MIRGLSHQGTGRKRGPENSGQIRRAFAGQTFDRDRNDSHRGAHSGRVFEKLDRVTPMLRMWDTRREQVAAAASRRNDGFRLDLNPPRRHPLAYPNRRPRGGSENHRKPSGKKTTPHPPSSGFDRKIWSARPSGRNWRRRREGAGATGFFLRNRSFVECCKVGIHVVKHSSASRIGKPGTIVRPRLKNIHSCGS